MRLSRFALGFIAEVALQVFAIGFCVAIWGSAGVLIPIYRPFVRLTDTLVEKWVAHSERGMAESVLVAIGVGILAYSLIPAVAAAFCCRRDENV